MSEKRYFDNRFADYDGKAILLSPERHLIGSVADEVKLFLMTQLNNLKWAQQNNKLDNDDASVYTGITGLVLLYKKLYDSPIKLDGKDAAVTCCEELLAKTRNHRLQKGIAFLCGNAGPLSVLAVLYSDNRESKEYVYRLLKLADMISDDKVPDELLYGRAGYLYALLYARSKLADNSVPDEIIKKVVGKVIESGKRSCQPGHRLSLSYSWHGKQYIGAAHGYVGILYMLLQVKLLCPNCIEDSQIDLAVSCLDGLLDQCFPSGNMRSSFGSEHDRLIHWCHGAPGAVHLYALAYKIFRKPSYLSAAKRFAEVIWSRGLLQRGYGICHGVAGNGYAFLCMYQLTQEMHYLWKAIKFAEWCLSYGQHRYRIPDRPYSLFEGLAGTLHFLHDILIPESAMFPAFQLVSYQ